MVQHDVKLSDREIAEGKQPSSWVIMARQERALGSLAADTRWQPLTGAAKGTLWTDNYSNILQVLRWR
jgi:hypothetical protein